MEYKQDWKSLQDDIRNQIEEGLSKREAYQRYREHGEDKDIRLFLATLPNLEARQRFIFHNKTLVWLWCFIVFFETLGVIIEVIETSNILKLLSLAIPVLILIGLTKFNGMVYLPGILYGIWNLFGSLRELTHYTNEDWNDPYIVTLVIVYLITVIISILLLRSIRKNVFGYYNWFYPHKDNRGNYLFA